VRWSLALIVPACFSPNPQTGAPCVTDRDCPAPQVCDLGTNTCQLAGSTGDAPSDGANDGTVLPDGGLLDCWAAWKSGTPSFTAPQLVTELNSDKREQDPEFSADALTIYFVRADVIHRATRPTRTAPFDASTPISEIDAAGNESRFTITSDGALAVFESRRVGGEGGADLWQTTLGLGGLFGTPTQTPLASVNDALNQFDPELTSDGLRLYYASFDNGFGTILVASRASRADAFGPAAPISTDLDATTSMFDPSLSPDELVLVFGTPSGIGGTDIHFATRTSKNDPFTSRGKIQDLDALASNGDAEVSSDGCTVIFGSDRAGGQGSRDLWMSQLTD
jgi:hypothetical protein